MVSEQHRGGDAVPVEGKQNKVAVAEERNRQALGEILNLETVTDADGKPQPQITRPITRRFASVLTARSNYAFGVTAAKPKEKITDIDAADTENGKIGNLVTVTGADGKPQPQITRPITRRFASVLTARSNYACGEIGNMVTVRGADGKPQPQITRPNLLITRRFASVLTARTNYACGVTAAKRKEMITDIDAADTENELAAVEYVADIYKFYKLIENESQPHDYMDSQPEINDKMRAILVDWLTEVHNKYGLMPETLYLTINIIDRFLARKIVPRKQLQLVGISAMLTASKYEERRAPGVNDLVSIADHYTHRQILSMEKTILGELEWSLTVPTLYVFLVRFIKASMSNLEMENLVYFLAELGMTHYATIRYCPSMVAASAVYAARCTLNKTPIWNTTLELHTGFSETQLNQCARLLVSFHQMAAESMCKVVHRKYSNPDLGAVALLPPAKNFSDAV